MWRMAQSPIIHTNRLEISPFQAKHCTDDYISWLNDPDIVRYSEQRHQLHTRQTCEAYYQSFLDSTCPHYFWAILTKTFPDKKISQRHIGTLTAYLDPLNQIADLGIMIGEKSLWGNGYGLEAWQAILNYLLTQQDIRKLTAGMISTNQAMLKLTQKSGMHLDGRRIRHCCWENMEVDVIYTAIFNEA